MVSGDSIYFVKSQTRRFRQRCDIYDNPSICSYIDDIITIFYLSIKISSTLQKIYLLLCLKFLLSDSNSDLIQNIWDLDSNGELLEIYVGNRGLELNTQI